MQVLTYPFLGLTEYALVVDLRQTATGCRAHYGSLSYAGHPAEAAEYQIEGVTLHPISMGKVDYSQTVDMPDWLRDELIEWAGEEDAVRSPAREEEAA